MKVAFLHMDVGQKGARQLAEIMVRSVKQVMREDYGRTGVEVVQLTDPMTPGVAGVDTIIRKPVEQPFIMEYRLSHFMEIEGEVMFIDTDAVVLKDPRSVFDRAFDVALTKRVGPILVDGKDIVPEMPYNTGVIFSRNPEFWKDCYAHIQTLSDKLRNWFGDQMAVKVIADSGKYNVRELTCDEYNYSPTRSDEEIKAYVAHYKGKRKQWMLNKYMEVA